MFVEVQDGVKQRKNENSQVAKDSSDHGDNSSTKQLTFHVEETGRVVSDFTKDGGFQKCVRFSPLMTHLVTGGADGHLRLWRVNILSLLIQ